MTKLIKCKKGGFCENEIRARSFNRTPGKPFVADRYCVKCGKKQRITTGTEEEPY